MNDPEDMQGGAPEGTQGGALTTGQIAAAGADRADRAGSGQPPFLADQAGQAERAEPPTSPQRAAGGSGLGTGDSPRAQLLDDAQRQGMLTQWKEIQAK